MKTETAHRTEPERRFCNTTRRGELLARQWPLKNRHARAPQRIALRLTMGWRRHQPIRMAGVTDVPVLAITIRRRGLRQPSRVTDRAKVDRGGIHVIADSLQALEDGLPLFPVELAEERTQPLDERILEKRFAIGLGNEEAVEANIESFGDLFESA